MTHEIIWEAKGVYKRFTGFITFSEYSPPSRKCLPIRASTTCVT